MTFRRLFTADGIHDYFWKARPGRSLTTPTPRPRADPTRRGGDQWHRTESRTGWPSSAWAAPRFGEHWDKGLDDLIVDAADRGLRVGRRDQGRRRRLLVRHRPVGMSGITLARPLQLEGKPVTRVENYCTTGSEALRAAAYAVASGAYDVAMAVGAEKVKDSGYQGLNAVAASRTTAPPARSRRRPCSPWWPRPTPRSTASTRTR